MNVQQAEINLAQAVRDLQEARAEHDGEVAGRADYWFGRVSQYAWFVESAPGYSRSYSLGYRRGWLGASRARRES